MRRLLAASYLLEVNIAMSMIIREFTQADLLQIIPIWNEVVEEGNAFPQDEPLTSKAAVEFFQKQSFTGVLEQDSEVLGLYILHPNNVGRCGHIANASYAVRSRSGGLGIGERLVLHSLKKGRELGFRLLQFNAVVKSNNGAIHLYEKLGFHRTGEVPGGFYGKNGEYEDIILFSVKLA